MKCITINNHDYATRAHGDPTENAALNNIMREQTHQPRPSRIRYTTDGRTQVVRYARLQEGGQNESNRNQAR